MARSALARREQPAPAAGGTTHRRVVELLAVLHEVDPTAIDHQWRVARRAMALGEALGLGYEETRALWYGGLLHDVGKIGVPAEVLGKRGPLTRTERAQVQLHPELGAAILEDLVGLEEVARLVLHHQERWDGRREGRYPGYPTGLAGDAIPLGARILAVVDAYDAMTSDRPYRRGLPAAAAAAELQRQAGRQFDPRVVAAFLGVVGG
ncbi:MAG TPA: HD-GYP domain-containing protein [Thermoanaerobaculia bacterium]|nr:HD-GYP domain-containing protein [Thermoanaerobaculia bacterium]